jgi:two-component sensor histidine kinase
VANVLARKTFANTDRTALVRFSERLAALAVATDMLGGEEADQADLHGLIDAVIAPQLPDDRSAFILSGPNVTVGRKTASNLAMAIHELATNATKYGALSVERGSVSIEWGYEGSKLHLKWRERDGPPVSRPSQSGFGSLLISQALFHAPNRGELIFEPEGVRCDVVLVEGVSE